MKITHKSSTGNIYIVDLENLSCTCPHYLYRLKRSGGLCKHIQTELDKYKDQLEKAKEFIKTNNNAIEFVEMFGEEVLNLLKKQGEVFENNGKLEEL